MIRYYFQRCEYGDIIVASSDGKSGECIWLKGSWKANKVGTTYADLEIEHGIESGFYKELTENEVVAYLI